MKAFFIRKVFNHHSSMSGYDALFSHFKNINSTNFYYDKNEKWLRGWGWFLSLFNRKLKARLSNYNNIIYLNELLVLLLSKAKNFELIHISYIEPHVFLVNKYKKKYIKGKLIGTIHLPATFWEFNIYNLDTINNFDGLIVLDKKSEKYFKSKLEIPIKFIPHGVNINYFSPSATRVLETNFKCLICGNFLRDYNLLEQVIVSVFSKPDTSTIFFDIVISKEMIQTKQDVLLRINKYDNVKLHFNISNTELLGLYQHSDIGFLPLLDSTANNVLLEMISCGLPVITTKGGIESYLLDGYYFLYENHQHNQIAEKIVFLSANKAVLKEMSDKARETCIREFSWEVVSKKTVEFYQEICSTADNF